MFRKQSTCRLIQINSIKCYIFLRILYQKKLLQQNQSLNCLIIFMQAEPIYLQSSDHIQNQASLQPRPIAYAVVPFLQINYRVPALQFRRQYVMVMLWCVFWISAAFTTSGVLIGNFFELRPFYPLSAGVFASFAINAFVLKHLKFLDNSILIETLNLAIYLTALLVLSILRVEYSIAPTALFATIQLIISIQQSSLRGKCILKIICLLEIGLISLKCDSLIQISWAHTFLAIAVGFILLAAASVFIIVYSLINHFAFTDPVFEFKLYGIAFLASSLVSFSAILCILFTRVYFQTSIIVPTIISVAVELMTVIYIWKYQNEISIFFCQGVESIQTGQKNIQIQKVAIEKKASKRYLYKLSQNWLSQAYNQSKAQPNFAKQGPQCIICMQKQSDMVWMSCGHLAVCDECTQSLFKSKIVTCVLCKKMPSQILKICCQSKSQGAASNPEKSQEGSKNFIFGNQFRVVETYKVNII